MLVLTLLFILASAPIVAPALAMARYHTRGAP